MNVAVSMIIAYLLGSIPSAFIAGKIKGIDLREHGSGNLGFTNAYRLLGAKMSIPVLVFDIFKGSAAVLLAHYFADGNEIIAIAAGLLSIAGHNWTIFLGFRGGGKGVATSAGVFLILTPIPFLAAVLVFLVILSTTRYMSLSCILLAMTLVIASGILLGLKHDGAPSIEVFIFTAIAALLIVLRHHSNIRRLFNGTESKFGSSTKEE